jgi:hypothetical protein
MKLYFRHIRKLMLLAKDGEIDINQSNLSDWLQLARFINNPEYGSYNEVEYSVLVDRIKTRVVNNNLMSEDEFNLSINNEP